MIPSSTKDLSDEYIRLSILGQWDEARRTQARQLTREAHFDWSITIERAIATRLAGIFYDQVKEEDIPEAICQTLRHQYMQTASANLFQVSGLKNVLPSLKESGIEVILLKGVALAETVYSNPGVRPMGDVDILVHSEHVEQIRAILQQRGYEAMAIRLRTLSTKGLLKSIPMLKPGRVGVELDIHWHLFKSSFHLQFVPIEWFWETAIPIDLGGIETLGLGLEANLLFLSEHFLKHQLLGEDYWYLWLLDVCALIRTHQDEIDWDLLLQRAQDFRLLHPLKESLRHAVQIWETPIPESVQNRLEALPLSKEEMESTYVYSSEERPFIQLRDAIKYRRGVIPAMRYLLAEIFPSAAFMRHKYTIKRSFSLPFYYLYRWYEVGRRAFGLLGQREHEKGS